MLIKGDKREQINSLQFYLDRDLTAPAAQKIVNVFASAVIFAVEPLAGEAKVDYKVNYKVIYIGEEGLKSLEDSYDRSVVLKSSVITPKSYLDLNAAVVASEYVGVNNLKIRSTIEIRGFAVADYSFAAPEITESDIFVKNTPFDIENVVAIKESEIIASSDCDMKEKMDAILAHDTQIMINSVSSATEVCEIRGECYTYVNYLSEGKLSSRCVVTPFTAEILAPGVKEGSRAYCTGRAASASLTLPSGDTGTLKTEIVVAVKGFSITAERVDLCVDAYSAKRELNISYADAVIEENVCLTDATEKIYGVSRLNGDKARIRSVLAVCPPSAGVINVINNGKLAVEGIVTVSVIYLDEDEKINGELIEIPYHYVIAKDFPCKESLYARAVISAVSARAKHNDEIEVSGEIRIEVYGSGEKIVRYVGKIEAGGSREENECAISLYIAKRGESLWDVAKALLTDEETLLGLNPEIKLPFNGGEKILFYREL